MKIQTIINHINTTQGLNISSDYYDIVAQWQDWWNGVGPTNMEQDQPRSLYNLRMAKKVCEDWASLLFNQNTNILIGDKTSSEFVRNQVFKDAHFWEQGNALIENAFSTGTGAFVLKLHNLQVQGQSIVKNSATKVQLDYLSATGIIPLTVCRGKIVDVAFASEVVEQGEKILCLETHTLTATGYQIKNERFTEENGVLTTISLPSGTVPVFHTGSNIPLFTMIKPNIVNIHNNANGLGMAVFAQAIDNLTGVDLAYNNLNCDCKLGGKKVFYSESLIQQDENGNQIAPDDGLQQLFVQFSDIGDAQQVSEFNPVIRADENINAIQAQLNYLSFKCGLGVNHYQFNTGTIATTPQFAEDKQKLVQNTAKHFIIIENALLELVQAILWAGKEVIGLVVDPDCSVSIVFDDSHILDSVSERQRDLQEIRDGIQQKYEYRMKWYGEDEETAKRMITAT